MLRLFICFFYKICQRVLPEVVFIFGLGPNDIAIIIPLVISVVSWGEEGPFSGRQGYAFFCVNLGYTLVGTHELVNIFYQGSRKDCFVSEILDSTIISWEFRISLLFSWELYIRLLFFLKILDSANFRITPPRAPLITYQCRHTECDVLVSNKLLILSVWNFLQHTIRHFQGNPYSL